MGIDCRDFIIKVIESLWVWVIDSLVGIDYWEILSVNYKVFMDIGIESLWV